MSGSSFFAAVVYSGAIFWQCWGWALDRLPQEQGQGCDAYPAPRRDERDDGRALEMVW
jgi:hypothetical protein